MITFIKVKNNPHILEFIKQSEKVLKNQGYTDHGLLHGQSVANRARTIAKEIGLTKEDQEMAAISGFCHDMGNFLSRSNHNYFGAILFYQVFKDEFLIEKISIIMQAISVHDKEEIGDKEEAEMNFSHLISAILIIADKSDVRKERVCLENLTEIKKDIHDRVNYATYWSKLKIDKKRKKITLFLKIDTKVVPIMEYFEIFTQRMVYCRKAAKYLGYNFGLVINNFKLL
ncbi:MAG: HD domain-containing protein [Patescibacteria group bacterium]